MLRVFALMFAGLLASTTSLAADNGVYLGAGISQASVDFESAGLNLGDDSTKFKVIAGVRPLDWLAVEVNYVDFGTFEDAIGPFSFEYELKGIDAFAVGLIEVGLVDFFAKVGVIRWDQEASINNVSTSIDDSGNDLAFGGGVGFHFGSIGLRAEYEKFEVDDDVDVDLITLALTWTFL